MAKAKKSKPKKERAKNYDSKLAVEGEFIDVFKVVKKNREDNLNKQQK